MNKMLGVALAAGLALSSGSAYALDKVGGVVQKVDAVLAEFTIVVAGDQQRQIHFQVPAEMDFDELNITVGESLSVQYDASECGSNAECVSTVKAIDRNG